MVFHVAHLDIFQACCVDENGYRKLGGVNVLGVCCEFHCLFSLQESCLVCLIVFHTFSVVGP